MLYSKVRANPTRHRLLIIRRRALPAPETGQRLERIVAEQRLHGRPEERPGTTAANRTPLADEADDVAPGQHLAQVDGVHLEQLIPTVTIEHHPRAKLLPGPRQRAVEVLEGVRERLTALGSLLGGAIKQGNVADVEPAYVRLPVPGDCMDELVFPADVANWKEIDTGRSRSRGSPAR